MQLLQTNGKSLASGWAVQQAQRRPCAAASRASACSALTEAGPLSAHCMHATDNYRRSIIPPKPRVGAPAACTPCACLALQLSALLGA